MLNCSLFLFFSFLDDSILIVLYFFLYNYVNGTLQEKWVGIINKNYNVIRLRYILDILSNTFLTLRSITYSLPFRFIRNICRFSAISHNQSHFLLYHTYAFPYKHFLLRTLFVTCSRLRYFLSSIPYELNGTSCIREKLSESDKYVRVQYYWLFL